MTSQFGQLRERGVVPDQDLVLGVAVRAHQLIAMLRPGQIAHLHLAKVGK